MFSFHFLGIKNIDNGLLASLYWCSSCGNTLNLMLRISCCICLWEIRKPKQFPPFAILDILAPNLLRHLVIVQYIPVMFGNKTNSHHFLLRNLYFNIFRNVNPIIGLIHVDDVLNNFVVIFISHPFFFNLDFFFCHSIIELFSAIHQLCWISLVNFSINKARIETVVFLGIAQSSYHGWSCEHEFVS